MEQVPTGLLYTGRSEGRLVCRLRCAARGIVVIISSVGEKEEKETLGVPTNKSKAVTTRVPGN